MSSNSGREARVVVWLGLAAGAAAFASAGCGETAARAGGGPKGGGERVVMEPRVHEAAHIAISVPSGWRIDTGADTMTITDPADEVSLVFVIVEADDLRAALSGIDAQISRYVSDVTTEGEPREANINGLDAVLIDGTGTAGGVPVDLGLMVVKTPTGKALLVFGIAQTAALHKHEATLKEVMNSLKPLN